MIWHFIKYWASFFIPTFYRRIQGANIKNLQVKGPVIIAMNHPNAFTDPIAITYVSYPLRVHYMARGDAFKPGIVAWLLEKIGLVPIFRLQDAGKEGLLKNDDSYRRVNYLLSRNAKMIVFAEGICIQERRLRPLKKGVARMVFGAYSHLKNDTLRVVPVGVNYSHPSKFRSDVFYNVGEPIFVKDFQPAWLENPARAHKQFLAILEPAMKKLVTHINDPKDDHAVYAFEKLCKQEMLLNQGLQPGNLAHEFEIVKQITEKINQTSVDNPVLLSEFKQQSELYFKHLKTHRLKDWTFRPSSKSEITLLNVSCRLFALFLSFPFFAIGMAGNFLSLFFVKKLTDKLVKHREFYSSFALGFGMVIFPLTYIAWFFIFYFFCDLGPYSFLACAVLALCGGFCLWYFPFLKDTFAMIRKLRNPLVASQMDELRGKILGLINKF